MLHIKEFLISPNDKSPFENYSIKVKLAISIVWFLFGLVFASLIQAIVKLIMERFGLFFKIDEFNYTLSTIKETLGILKYLLIVIVIGPVYEEFIFRYGLNFKKNSLIVSLSLASSIFFISYVEIITNPISLFLPVSTFFVTFYILNKIITNRMIHYVKVKHTKLIIYLFATAFALIHISNVENFDFALIPYYVVSVLPLFNLAMVSSFLRINICIIYSIGFHIFWNILVTIFTL